MPALDGSIVGFVGLGKMGRHMATNLFAAGARLVVHNRSRAVVDELQALGMQAADTPAAVARRTKIMVLMLPDTPAVESVLFSDNGIVAGLLPGSLVIDMGTTAVTASRGFAKRLGKVACDYIDAPVSGGEVGAKAGNLSIMVGGDLAAVNRARPIFNVVGARVTHVGEVGAGQVAKAANQLIVGLTIGAVAEALVLARRAGVDPGRVRQALKGGFAESRILELHGQRMLSGEFEPGATVTTQSKDLSQALEFASSLNLKLPATELNLELYARLKEQGHSDLDHSALIKVIE